MSVTIGMVTGYGRVSVRDTALHVMYRTGGTEVTDGWIRVTRGSSTITRTIRAVADNARRRHPHDKQA
jgi:hypothetical protein